MRFESPQNLTQLKLDLTFIKNVQESEVVKENEKPSAETELEQIGSSLVQESDVIQEKEITQIPQDNEMALNLGPFSIKPPCSSLGTEDIMGDSVRQSSGSEKATFIPIVVHRHKGC